MKQALVSTELKVFLIIIINPVVGETQLHGKQMEINYGYLAVTVMQLPIPEVY